MYFLFTDNFFVTFNLIYYRHFHFIYCYPVSLPTHLLQCDNTVNTSYFILGLSQSHCILSHFIFLSYYTVHSLHFILPHFTTETTQLPTYNNLDVVVENFFYYFSLYRFFGYLRYFTLYLYNWVLFHPFLVSLFSFFLFVLPFVCRSTI